MARPSTRDHGRSSRYRPRTSRAGGSRRRRRWTRSFAALFTLLLLGLGVHQLRQSGLVPLNQAAEGWYDVHQANQLLVELPRDDAPHDDYVEWWYYNGHVQDEAGAQYSFHYVVFVINALATHTVAHASTVDHQALVHRGSQRRTPGNPSSGTVDRFDFALAGWSLSGGGGEDRLRFDIDGRRFDLRLHEAAPPVIQGGTGLLDFKGTGASYYYSRPRMQVSGTVTEPGQRRQVTGLAWFDHQWGDFEVFELGWDWFALQLDDGRDIMLYRLFDPRDGHPVLTSGTLAEGGETIVLADGDFRIEVLDHWLSPATARRYPIAWRVLLPKQGVDLSVTPLMQDNEFDARETTYMVYWEGPVRLGGAQSGVGYVELSGYGNSAADP